MLRDVEASTHATTVDTVFRASEYMFHLGRQTAWHQRERNWIEVIQFARAARSFRKQFSPWIQKILSIEFQMGMLQ